MRRQLRLLRRNHVPAGGGGGMQRRVLRRAVCVQDTDRPLRRQPAGLVPARRLHRDQRTVHEVRSHRRFERVSHLGRPALRDPLPRPKLGRLLAPPAPLWRRSRAQLHARWNTVRGDAGSQRRVRRWLVRAALHRVRLPPTYAALAAALAVVAAHAVAAASAVAARAPGGCYSIHGHLHVRWSRGDARDANPNPNPTLALALALALTLTLTR